MKKLLFVIMLFPLFGFGQSGNVTHVQTVLVDFAATIDDKGIIHFLHIPGFGFDIDSAFTPHEWCIFDSILNTQNLPSYGVEVLKCADVSDHRSHYRQLWHKSDSSTGVLDGVLYPDTRNAIRCLTSVGIFNRNGLHYERLDTNTTFHSSQNIPISYWEHAFVYGALTLPPTGTSYFMSGTVWVNP